MAIYDVSVVMRRVLMQKERSIFFLVTTLHKFTLMAVYVVKSYMVVLKSRMDGTS